MIALPIKHVKDFMNKLLLQDTFDRFLVSEASITTFTTFSIDGQLHADFYDTEKAKELKAQERTQVTWQEIKPFCYSVIKGRRTPLAFKFVFQLPSDEVDLLLARSGLPLIPQDVFGLFFNCQYHGESLTLTTGSSLRIFTMDKSLDQAWDGMLEDFLRRQERE